MRRKTFITVLILAFTVKLSAQCSTPIGSFPYTEDFEASDGGWTTGGTASDWAWGTPAKPVIGAAASGNKCWVTGGLANSSYNNGENSWLQSPCFSFASLAHPRISFSVFWEMERRFDGANLQYSIDAGANWTTLGNTGSGPCTATNWYNNSGITYLGGEAGWSGNIQSTSGSCLGGSGSNGWLTATHDLSFLAGSPQVLFRFRFGAGTTCNSYDGFAIDLFTIAETTAGPADFSYSCGASSTFSFTSTVPTCPSSYSWDFDDPGSGSNNTSSDPNPSHQFSAPGVYDVTLVITYPAAPTSTITHSVEVLNGTISVTNAIKCNGDNNGSILVAASGSPSPYQYTWNTTPPQHTAAISGLAAGTYTVTISTATAFCPVVASIDLAQPAALSISPAVTDAFCHNTNGAIKATVSGGTTPYIYSWSNGGSGAAISNLSPGNYSLLVTDANGCTATENNIPVSNIDKTVAVSLGSTRSICPGQHLVLNPGIYTSYLWQDNSTAPTYTVNSGGLYEVTVTDAQGCTGSSSVTIKEDCGDIYFPTVFTPNGDTRNDLFGAFGNITAVTNYLFKVYDRWGELVFVSSDPSLRWDGTLKGKKYNTGSFVWFVTYTLNGRPNQAQQGTVTLLR